MVRLLLEDVTLRRDGKTITVGVRFKAGHSNSFTLAVGLDASEIRRTPAEVIGLVDRLLDHHTEAGAAAELNRQGVLSGTGQPWSLPVRATSARALLIAQAGRGPTARSSAASRRAAARRPSIHTRASFRSTWAV